MSLDENLGASKPGRIDRRSVLKTVGGASALSVVGLGQVAATSRDSRFVGVTYDSYTHQSQDTATARIEQTDDGLKGALQVGGFTVPLGDGGALAPNAPNQQLPSYSMRKTSSEFRANGEPLDVHFRDRGHTIVGYLTRPTADHGKLAFTLAPDGSEATPESIEGGLFGGGAGIDGRPRKRMPKTGIPARHDPQPTKGGDD